jgi:hypothetical protein
VSVVAAMEDEVVIIEVKPKMFDAGVEFLMLQKKEIVGSVMVCMFIFCVAKKRFLEGFWSAEIFCLGNRLNSK